MTQHKPKTFFWGGNRITEKKKNILKRKDF